MLNDLILKRKSKIGTSSEKGFSLIEAIAVIVVLGILFAYLFFHSTSNNNLHTEVDMLKSHLRYVQYIALCGDGTYRWRITIDAGTNSYTFSRLTVATGATENFSLPGEISNTHTLASGVTVTAGAGTINFNEWGSSGSNNITVTLSQGGTSASIIITRNTGFIQ